MNKLTALLTGSTQEHLVELGEKFPSLKIHRDTREDFQRLRKEAQQNGFDLQPVSTFRSFQRQMQIWNLKACGKRILLDTQGNPLDYSLLSEREVVQAILRWSALPGFSRHHWGTELDVVDAKSFPSPDYNVQLTPSEVEKGGIFYAFHQWLDQKIHHRQSFGFFRPFDQDLGGVAPEKWHLSHAPVAQDLSECLSFEFFEELLESEMYTEMELRKVVLSQKEEIYSQYIKNVLPPPPL